MEYKVIIVENLRKEVSVEASSEREAIEKVKDAYENCELVLSADDFSTVEFYEDKDE